MDRILQQRLCNQARSNGSRGRAMIALFPANLRHLANNFSGVKRN
jgi:hypothetical protein